MALHRPQHMLTEARAILSFSFQSRNSIGNQEVADVGMRNVFAGAARFFGHSQRRASDLGLAFFRPFADALNDVPVMIARREIHPRINAHRVLSQLRVDQAHGFKEILPVER